MTTRTKQPSLNCERPPQEERKESARMKNCEKLFWKSSVVTREGGILSAHTVLEYQNGSSENQNARTAGTVGRWILGNLGIARCPNPRKRRTKTILDNLSGIRFSILLGMDHTRTP